MENSLSEHMSRLPDFDEKSRTEAVRVSDHLALLEGFTGMADTSAFRRVSHEAGIYRWA